MSIFFTNDPEEGRGIFLPEIEVFKRIDVPVSFVWYDKVSDVLEVTV